MASGSGPSCAGRGLFGSGRFRRGFAGSRSAAAWRTSSPPCAAGPVALLSRHFYAFASGQTLPQVVPALATRGVLRGRCRAAAAFAGCLRVAARCRRSGRSLRALSGPSLGRRPGLSASAAPRGVPSSFGGRPAGRGLRRLFVPYLFWNAGALFGRRLIPRGPFVSSAACGPGRAGIRGRDRPPL